MAGSAGGQPGQAGSGAVERRGCSAGHARPARVRGGWMCARCGLRVMPLTAEECFDGHERPADVEPWMLWVCPQDSELVIPADMDRDDVAYANRHHPFLADGIRVVHRDDSDPLDVSRGRARPVIIFTDPGSSPAEGQGPDQEQRQEDPNDTLVSIAGPILAGFALAAIVVIGTSSSTSGRPEALPAIAFFAGAAVLLLFSIQMLAVAALPGLRKAPGLRVVSRLLRIPRLQKIPWPRLIKDLLYETGLLVFLIGLGLFLWARSWSAAAIAGVAVVGLAVISDVALLVTSWLRPDWGRTDSDTDDAADHGQ
jgi:hypothetical protein